MVAEVTEGGGGAAVAVSARVVLVGFRAGVGAVPGFGGRVVRGHGDPADRAVAGQGENLWEPGSFARGLIEAAQGRTLLPWSEPAPRSAKAS